MKHKGSLSLLACLVITALVYAVQPGQGQDTRSFIPDKALCAKMLRFGKEAYQRGKYLDAKEYFRKAIQADPTAMAAWMHYDQSVIFALAEKVEKDTHLIWPDVSSRQEMQTRQAAPPQPRKPPPKQKDTEFRIVDDEGC